MSSKLPFVPLAGISLGLLAAFALHNQGRSLLYSVLIGAGFGASGAAWIARHIKNRRELAEKEAQRLRHDEYVRSPFDFRPLFAPEPIWLGGGARAGLRRRRLGALTLRSSKIALFDGIAGRRMVLASDFPLGEHQAWVLETSGDDRRTQYLVVEFGERASKWLLTGQIEIDSGSLSLCDASLEAKIDEFVDRQTEDDLSRIYADAAETGVVDSGAGTLIHCPTGFGDGVYDIFLAASAEGTPSSMVICFDDTERFRLGASS